MAACSKNSKELTASHVDLSSLLSLGVKIKAVNQDVKHFFDSLDLCVPYSLKVRYLMLCVHKELESNSSVYEKWLSILSEYGFPSEIVKLVTSRDNQQPFIDFESCGPIMFSMEGASVHVHTKHFLACHIAALTDILISVAHKYTNIGISLNLPANVRDDIRSTLIATGSVKKCLRRLLEEWIVKNHEHASPPTIESLEKALRSNSVGLGKEANELQSKILGKLGVCLTKKGEVFTGQPSAVGTPPPLEIVSQSRDAEVTEEKSTLLEVQVITTTDSTITYQWKKDGCALNDSISYSGCTEHILRLRYVTIASNGSYTCICACEHRATNTNPAVVETEPISIKVEIAPIKKILVDMYLLVAAQEDDSWPPKINTSHISLDIKQQGTKQPCSQDTDLAILDTAQTEYQKAFGTYTSGALILVKGLPGSGKTTLMHKISRDWANGGLALKGAKLLFRFRLKSLSKHGKVSLKDILKLFYDNNDTIEGLIGSIEASNGENVCFIMDGLNEYNCENDDESAIFKLINKNYLQRSMVIVTSRSVATFRLKRRPDREVDVLGFAKEQVHEYVLSYPFLNRKSVESVKVCLSGFPSVLNTCRLPMYTSMVCFLHDQMHCSFPHTESGIYHQLLMLTLIRSLRRSEISTHLTSLNDLTGECKENFHKICKFAFNTILPSKTAEKQSLASGKSDEPHLDLISVSYSISIGGVRKLHTFVDPAFQIYLAAYCMSKVKDEKVLKFISRYSSKIDLRPMMRFYCGFVKFTSSSRQLLFRSILQLQEHDCLFHCQCAFESQQSRNCTCVVQFEEGGSLSFKGNSLGGSDFAALGYVLSNTMYPLKILRLWNCQIGNGLEILADNLRHCKQLQTLEFSYNVMSEHDVAILASGLKWCDSILEIDFSGNDISNSGATALADSLGHCNSLKALYLNENRFGDKATIVLCRALQKCDKLEVLDLTCNQISDEGAKGFLDGLKNCASLNSLHIADNHLGPCGVAYVAESLQFCNKLESLELDNNKVSGHGARVLSSALRSIPNLKNLGLSSTGITDDDIEIISTRLYCLTSLQSLNLNTNGISDQGARTLATSLSQLRNLQRLKLSSNKIGNIGAHALVKALEDHASFEKLDLTNNNISDDGVELIIDCLNKHNN